MKRLLIATMALALALSAGPAFAAEDSSDSITMSPTSKRATLNPGESVTDKVTVLNSGKKAYDFSVYARPYSVKGEAYEPVFNSTAENTDSNTWIQFDKSNYRLEPGKSVDVGYTINVPSNTQSGGHYAVLFAETEAKSSEGTAVVRNKRVGAIMYTAVNGNNTVKGEVLETSIPFFQSSAPLVASSRVKNSGNVDFTDTTTMTVRNIFGNKKHSEVRESTVLPNTNRKMTYAWKNSASVGIYKVTISHDMLKKKTETSGYVVMMPVWLIVIVILALMGVIYGVVAKRRQR